jgi:beta-glucosidase
MEGGNSIADLLRGKVNPSGKLTMTWPIAATDHASTKNFPGSIDDYTFKMMVGNKMQIPGHAYTNHEEDIYVGYRYFDTFNKNVAYPFGYGLSYTTFAFSKPVVKAKGKDAVEVSITVKNTGKVSGKEVAQVYVQAPEGKLEKPCQELKAFAKTRELQPGESQVLTMTIPVRDLASFDEAGSQWITEAGTYTFRIGNSSRDIAATATLKIAEYTEKTTNALAPKQKLNLLKKGK